MWQPLQQWLVCAKNTTNGWLLPKVCMAAWPPLWPRRSMPAEAFVLVSSQWLRGVPALPAMSTGGSNDRCFPRPGSVAHRGSHFFAGGNWPTISPGNSCSPWGNLGERNWGLSSCPEPPASWEMSLWKGVPEVQSNLPCQQPQLYSATISAGTLSGKHPQWPMTTDTVWENNSFLLLWAIALQGAEVDNQTLNHQ
jgi:hypothetical protein